MRSVPRHPAHLHLHLLRSPSHPVACTAQVVRPATIRSSSPRCSPRQSLQCRRQVSCPFPGEKYGTPRHPNLLSTPQVRASDLFDLTLNELSGVAAYASDPVLQHVRRQTDGIHGLRLRSCLACSRSRQLATPGGMPASARQAEKGSAALAVPASLPCSLLLLRLVEPAKELARLPHLFPGRIDWPSPDKSVASSAEFRERAPFLPRFRLAQDLHHQAVHHIREG